MSGGERDERAVPKQDAPGVGEESGAAGGFYRELSIPLLAHELKGPLAVIETGIRTLLDRGGAESDARRERTLRRVLRSALRARALVDDLLEIGRAEAGLVERTAFRPSAALLDSVVDAVEAMDAELAERIAAAPESELLAELARGGVEVAVSDRARASVVEQDERKFSIVAANLLRNALRFRGNRVAVALDVDEGTVRLTVEDDGPGVAAEDRERIFERWARGIAEGDTGSRQGHGLGLAAARVLARGLGGDVTLQGDRGSRFLFELPLSSR
jgi:signal transduction histidine kinase